MKLGSTLLTAAIMAMTTAFAQHSGSVHSRSSLTVASSANMERIQPKAGLNANDKMFMKDAAIINMAEVKLGQLAQRNGAAWGRMYGKDMEREHTMALEEQKKLARNKGVWLPKDMDAKHQMAYAKLSQLRGAAFDRSYRDLMIKGHGMALTKIQKEMRSGRDSMVRGYAVTMEPAVKMHMKMAQTRTSMMHHG